ncbi:MAG: histidine phosphatase family protein [Bacteroidia bacterium]|nr:histidine phosphatase family protein [Bacteroidia bacterium]
MTRTLYLLRHADCEPTAPGKADHLRGLTDDGNRQVENLVSKLTPRKLKIDAVYSSPAKRARQTAEGIIKGLGLKLKIVTDDRLYNATPQKLLEVTSQLPDELTHVLVVGHNPGLPGFVTLIANTPVESMPTAAWVNMGVSVDQWAELGPGKAEIVRQDVGTYAR